jgi:multidrug efflux system membrane fusion protein
MMLLALVGAQPLEAAQLQATLQWGQRAELGSLVSGVVAEVPVRAGQSVNKGDVLVHLDDRGFRARLQGAQAAVTQAKVRFEEAEREHERALELYDRTVLSEHERQLAEIAHEEARAQLAAARALRVQAELDLERSTVAAPYDALVLAVRTSAGEVVVADLQSRPLVAVAERGRLVARALASAAELAELQVGVPVDVEVRGARLDGVVSHIGLEPEQGAAAEPLYPLEVTLQLPGNTRLHVGETAIIRWGREAGES